MSWNGRGDRDDGEKEEEERSWSEGCDRAEMKMKWRRVEKMGEESEKVNGPWMDVAKCHLQEGRKSEWS